MTDQDKILQFLHLNGPVLPAKVAKSIDSNILLASAMLSDLVSQGKVKVSNLKIGGSPLYHLPGQEDKLYQFASGNMNPKDLQILNHLKEKKVLREANLDLLMKVSLRSLKDFAIPLQVTANGIKELFWKWHLLSAEETNVVIRGLVSPAKKEIFPGTSPDSPIQNQQKTHQDRPHHPPLAELEKEQTPLAQEEHKVFNEKREETIKRESLTLTAQNHPPLAEEVKEEEGKARQAQEGTTPVFMEKRRETIEEEKDDKKPFLQKFKEKIIRKKKVDELFPPIENFFTKLRISIEQKETIRKNAEMNFLLKVPTAVGKITYFCKAKQKKRCDEKDLSSAYMEAQMKKLPLLFLYTNELSKKAEEMLDSGTFENVVVKKIE